MIVTNVYFRKILDDSNKLKALASVTFDGVFVIHGVKVLENKEGHLFIGMPRRKDDNDRYSDIVHPINNDLREHIHKRVIAAYCDLDAKQRYAKNKLLNFEVDEHIYCGDNGGCGKGIIRSVNNQNQTCEIETTAGFQHYKFEDICRGCDNPKEDCNKINGGNRIG